MIDKITNFLESLKNIPTYLLVAVTIALALLIFLPDRIADLLAIKDFCTSYRSWLGPAFLVAASICGAKAVIGLFGILQGKNRLKAMRLQLHNLTDEEKGYLSQFILAGKNTIYVNIDDGIAGGLSVKSIIYRSSNLFNVLDGIPYNLQPWAREYLGRHQELLADGNGTPLTPKRRLHI